MFNLDSVQIKGDRVLVKKLPFQDKVGTFYVPESVIERKAKRRGDAWKGEVMAVGDKVDFETLRGEIKKGDIVYLAPVSLDCPAFAGEDGEEYIIVTQEDVLAMEEK